MPTLEADRIILVDTDPDVTASFADANPYRVATGDEIVNAFVRAPQGTRFVAPTTASLAAPLAGAANGRTTGRRHDALVLSDGSADGGVQVARQRMLRALFDRVVFADPRAAEGPTTAAGGAGPQTSALPTDDGRTRRGRRTSDRRPATSYLPLAEMAEVLVTDHRDEYVIGGVVDQADGVVLLYRGTLDPLVVRLDFFRPAGTGLAPDFDDFEVVDYGQSLRFGAYEASVDVVLYDQDPAFRRRVNARRLAQDPSFGAAFKRLRLHRGLGQGDFAPLTERQVRRIEQIDEPAGARVHAKTKRILEERLGVPFGEITTF